MRTLWGRVLTALLLTVAFLGAGMPAAMAGPGEFCRFRFDVTTGPDDGLRDDSLEHVRVAGQELLFDDWNGDGVLDDPTRPYHRGGTGDAPSATHHWTARLPVCVDTAGLAGGFTIEHASFADDWNADNWDLAGLVITSLNPDGTDDVELFRRNPGSVMHRFQKNSDQILTLPIDTSGLPQGPAQPAPGPFCRFRITVTTVPGDGIRDDSFEHVRVAGQDLLFEDWDGDGSIDVPTRPYHRGGTRDAGDETFRWNARLPVCTTAQGLRTGFTIEHVSFAEDWRADNWTMTALRIESLDDGTVFFDRTAAPGASLHTFRKNADQFFSTLDQDSDGDGLSDRIELTGLPGDPWLPANGADPCRTTVAVEVDWLSDGTATGDHQPDNAAFTEAVAMFDAAPLPAMVSCPYGQETRPGVQLLVHVDDLIPVSPEERVRPLNVEQGGQTPFQRHRAANFTAGRSGLFRYNLWGFRHDASTSGGVCCDGPDFMVTLGTWPGRPIPVRAQSGTFVHELGHAIGLDHGGDEEVNFKPNYLSVMNYTYGFVGIPDFGEWRTRLPSVPATNGGKELLQALDQVSTLSYSTSVLPELDRMSLDEGSGIGVTTDVMAAWWDNSGTLRVGDGSAALDWDADGVRAAGPVRVDVNGEFQACVDGTDPDRTPPVDDTVRTPVTGTDDLARYGMVYAGLNGICDVTAVADDTEIRPRGYDYPEEWGYAQGLDGAEDWSLIDVRRGLAGGAGGAVSVSEPGTEEIARFRTRMAEALVAASGPTPAAARWGYAYMDRATPTEAPIGVETQLNPYWQWTTAGLARRATVVHTGTGRYDVRLPGVASADGTAHVTAYRTVYRGRTCGVVGHAPDGPDQVVEVRCFDHTGAPADWWFTIFFAAPATGSAPYATVAYDDGAGGAATVDPVHSSGTFNSAGGVNRVVREGAGRYRVVLEGIAEDTGHVQVTPYGDGPATRCAPRGVTATAITVVCHAIAGGAPADSPWLLSFADGSGLHRDAATPAAYVTVTGDPADPEVDGARSFSSNGETPEVARLGVGYYRLTWQTLGKTRDNVQVTATGPGDTYCHLGTIDSYAAPPKLSVYIWCHDAAGARGDSLFGVAYIRQP
ncbi:hypothetical protein [Herbidospora cretacea]|uniref:hypothetical protein n=1 Tax=Herbidospora cretacea TaxID=28444 RepID=UPI0007732E50|nr:hypothetical protein [Herbidospora cretacea]